MKNNFYEASKDNNHKLFAQKQKQYNGRLHFHRAFELAYLTDGKADYIIEDESFIAQKDDIVFSHCYYRHKSFGEPEHEKYVIAVPENLSRDISLLFAQSTLPPLLEDKEFNRTLLSHFEKLVREADGMPEIVAKGYASILFGTLFQHYNSISVKPKNKNVAIIADILTYIDANFRDRLTLEGLSSQFGYNKSYFSRLFNSHIGMSINNYINMVRYDRFEKLYEEKGTGNITELVFDCGFTSLATFYRVREFRESLKNGKA